MPEYYTPDTRTRIQKALRFFARLESFALECPHCGRVYTFRQGKRSPSWDPQTGRFTCVGKGGCQKVYILGILAWPVGAAPRVATGTPEDQIPSPRQVAELRKDGGGWWLADEEKITEKRPTETNLTLEQDRPAAEAARDEEED